MSENQTSAKSTVEGELSLDELEKIAGGTASGIPVPEDRAFSSVEEAASYSNIGLRRGVLNQEST